jgi:hypothetical protein
MNSNHPEKIPGNISIQLIKRRTDESKNSEWYTISEKHIERIINDDDGFRIIFFHPLPTGIVSWVESNLYSNCRFQKIETNTLLWLDDPKKNFRCYKCKVLYEEGQSNSDSGKNSKFSIDTEFQKLIPIQYQVKSPTLLLFILSSSFLFDWSTPLLCIIIIFLGLSSQ